jgi:transcriptional regulator with XRE-family HTH domain
METIDIIRQLCSKKGIALSQLENELGYGNGSIAKSKNMSADRIYQIAQYFGVSMEYLITGKTLNEADDEIALLRQQQAILVKISQISEKILEYRKQIDKCQEDILQLKKDYNKVEIQKNKTVDNTATANKLPVIPDPLPIPDWPLPFDDEELPFN